MCYTDLGSARFQAASPELNQQLAEIRLREALFMTCTDIIALVTCIATVIMTVIAILTYFNKEKDE